MAEQLKVRRGHQVGRGILRISLLFLVGALLLLWSWNTVISGIFWLPNLQLKHAFSLEVLLAILYFPFIGLRLWRTESYHVRKGA